MPPKITASAATYAVIVTVSEKCRDSQRTSTVRTVATSMSAINQRGNLVRVRSVKTAGSKRDGGCVVEERPRRLS